MQRILTDVSQNQSFAHRESRAVVSWFDTGAGDSVLVVGVYYYAQLGWKRVCTDVLLEDSFWNK